MMRTSKSIKNAIIAFITNFITIVIAFIAQTIFIKYLGKEYNGINSLFSNIISMLGVVELGIGSALIFHLYEPIANNDKEKIISLMNFYKKSYRLIALIIFILSLLILPFIKFFVDTTLNINIYIIFILFSIESVCSYLLSYKRSILIANQENYIINIVRIIYILLLNSLQILSLILTKNYYFYLILKIFCRIIENIIITIIANKKYPFINEDKNKNIDDKTKGDIFEKVKGLLFHKIGSYIVLGTDNIIISKFLGIVVVGIYSNYVMIINGVISIFSQIFYSITASIGNLLVEKKSNKSFVTYKNINFINFWISCFACISFYIISKPFVLIWLGNDYLLNEEIVLCLTLKMYLDLYGYTIGAFKNAAGIFYEDRFVPIIQSVVNIIVSVALVLIMGLPGVIIGTIASSMVLYFYSYPKLVYNKIFKQNVIKYYCEFFKNLILFILILIVTIFVNNLFVFESNIINILWSCCIAFIVPNLLVIIIFNKSEGFNFIFSIIKKFLKKRKTS